MTLKNFSKVSEIDSIEKSFKWALPIKLNFWKKIYKMLGANHIYVEGFNEVKIASVLILKVEIAISFNVSIILK